MGCTGGSKEKAINPFTKIPSLTQRQEGVCVCGGGGVGGALEGRNGRFAFSFNKVN